MPEIKDHYCRIIRELAADRPEPASIADHHIAPTADDAHVMAYAMKYVVSDKHYRYRQYRKHFVYGLSSLEYEPDPEHPLLHVDVGCGPGLFTWVVLDQLRREEKERKRIAVHPVGYDHSRAIIRLAKRCCERLQPHVNTDRGRRPDHPRNHLPTPSFVCGRREFQAWIEPELKEKQSRDIIVTFGHILVQTSDADHATQDFAWIMTRLAELEFRRFLLVASDAHSRFRPVRFIHGWTRLLAGIEPGLKVMQLGRKGDSWASAELQAGK